MGMATAAIAPEVVSIMNSCARMVYLFISIIMSLTKMYHSVLTPPLLTQLNTTITQCNIDLHQAQPCRFMTRAAHSSWLIPWFQPLIHQVAQDFDISGEIGSVQFVLEVLNAQMPPRTNHVDLGAVIVWNFDDYPHSAITSDQNYAFVANSAVTLGTGVEWSYSEPIAHARRSVWIYLAK